MSDNEFYLEYIEYFDIDYMYDLQHESEPEQQEETPE